MGTGTKTGMGRRPDLRSGAGGGRDAARRTTLAVGLALLGVLGAPGQARPGDPHPLLTYMDHLAPWDEPEVTVPEEPEAGRSEEPETGVPTPGPFDLPSGFDDANSATGVDPSPTGPGPETTSPVPERPALDWQPLSLPGISFGLSTLDRGSGDLKVSLHRLEQGLRAGVAATDGWPPRPSSVVKTPGAVQAKSGGTSVTVGQVAGPAGGLPVAPGRGQGAQVNLQAASNVDVSLTRVEAPNGPQPSKGSAGVEALPNNGVTGVTVGWRPPSTDKLRVELSVLEGETPRKQGKRQSAGTSMVHDRVQGVRVMARDPSERLQFETHYGRGTSWTEPLGGPATTAAVATGEPSEAGARRVKGSVHLVKDRPILGDMKTNLTVTASQETVDPGFGAGSLGGRKNGREADQVGVEAGVGLAKVRLERTEVQESLPGEDAGPGRWSLNRKLDLNTPLVGLIPGSFASVWWLPSLSVGLAESLQAAAGPGTGGAGGPGPEAPPSIDVRRVGTAGLTWDGARWSAGVKRTSSAQFDRVLGSEETVLDEVGTTLEATFRPVDSLGVTSSWTSSDREDPRRSKLEESVRHLFAVDWTIRPGVSLKRSWENSHFREGHADVGRRDRTISTEIRIDSRPAAPDPDGRAVEGFLRHSVTESRPLVPGVPVGVDDRSWSTDVGVTVRLF